MTKKQIREYKQANQERKAALQEKSRNAPAQSKHYYATAFNPIIQDGKFTKPRVETPKETLV